MNPRIQMSRHRIYAFLTVILLSAIASLYASLEVDVINNDGILYMQTAAAFIAGGYAKAMEVFSWPFFPIVIAWLHLLTGLGLETSAYVINAIMLIIASVAFLRISEEICPAKANLWVPVLIVVTLPLLNDYRSYVIRGHGYWAFTLLALQYFIIYYKQSSMRAALLWQVFAVLGVLFRIEGVVFILFAPFLFLFYREKRASFLYHYIRLTSILIPAAIVAVVVLFGYILKIERLSGALQLRLSYTMPSSLLTSIREASAGLESLMPRLSSSEALVVTVSGLMALVVFKLVKNINLFYLAIVVVGRYRRWISLSRESGIVLAFFAISIAPVVVIAGNQLFASTRYTVLPIIFFSLIASQYLAYLFQKLREEKRILSLSILMALVVLFFLDAIIHTSAIKGNIVTASEWVIGNIEPNAKVVCNNKRFVFYTKERCTYRRLSDTQPVVRLKYIVEHEDYNYMLIWVEGDDRKMRRYLGGNRRLELMKTFENKRHDEARIYKIRPQ